MRLLTPDLAAARWEVALAGVDVPGAAADGPLAADDGALYVVVDASRSRDALVRDVRAVALDRATGTLRWSVSVPPASDASVAAPAAGRRPLLAGSWLLVPTEEDGALVLRAIDRATGALGWRYARPGRGLPPSAAIWFADGALALLAYDGTVVLDATTGVVRRATDDAGRCLAGGRVLAQRGDDLVALGRGLDEPDAVAVGGLGARRRRARASAAASSVTRSSSSSPGRRPDLGRLRPRRRRALARGAPRLRRQRRRRAGGRPVLGAAHGRARALRDGRRRDALRASARDRRPRDRARRPARHPGGPRGRRGPGRPLGGGPRRRGRPRPRRGGRGAWRGGGRPRALGAPRPPVARSRRRGSARRRRAGRRSPRGARRRRPRARVRRARRPPRRPRRRARRADRAGDRGRAGRDDDALSGSPFR
ncbi:MAG: PQQ-binding-like beta-propeller repeat protein [Deltaproteobacteria bacterium]|nr:PQQ-binding-like beta-propeller repeat protein [Deltaproteobacteria bacterium]